MADPGATEAEPDGSGRTADAPEAEPDDAAPTADAPAAEPGPPARTAVAVGSEPDGPTPADGSARAPAGEAEAATASRAPAGEAEAATASRAPAGEAEAATASDAPAGAREAATASDALAGEAETTTAEAPARRGPLVALAGAALRPLRAAARAARPARPAVGPAARALRVGLLVALVAALLVRLTVRDAYPVAATLFYAGPPPVLAALSGVLALAYRRRWPRLAAALAAAAVAGAGWAAAAGLAPRDTPAPPGDASVLLWNAAASRGSLDADAAAAEVAAADPDLAVLVEQSSGLRGRVLAVLPEHRVAFNVGWAVVLVRGGAPVAARDVDLAGRGRAAAAELDVAGRPLRLVLADLPPDPERSRGPAFRALGALLASLPDDPPVLVVGDFNTPRDSVWFDPWTARFAHAFEAGGAGWAATWPVPLPVHALDHAWLGPGLDPGAADLGWTWVSDHRPLRFTFSRAPGR